MKHLALIMDGNRRWAKRNGLRPWFGHRRGAESIKQVVNFCLKKNISYLTLYTFSIENFKRSKEECAYIFEIIKNESLKHLDLFLEHGVCVRFIGDRTLFPESIMKAIYELEERTKDLKKLNLNFLFCYGGRQELIGGIKLLIGKIKQGILTEDAINEKELESCLWTRGIPEPELIIRTGGAHRLSNFLLYQAAYSEFYFTDCLWPDIDEVHLQKACDAFELTQRNFGS